MKKYILTVFVVFMAFGCGVRDRDSVRTEIDNLKSKHAPDRRVAVYDIDVLQKGKTLTLTGETNLPGVREELEQFCQERGLTYADSIQLLPAADMGEDVYAVVNVSACNLRGEPKNSAELVTQGLLGHPLKLYKHKRYWYYVQTPNGYLGWMDSGQFTEMNAEESKAWHDADKVIFTREYGHSFAEANDKSRHVSDLVLHNILKKVSVSGSWTQVEYPDGRQAYVRSSDCRDFKAWQASVKPDRQHIIETAYRFFSVPYMWGGTSAKALDCSGFSSTVYFENGVLLPRDASQQVLKGRTITSDVNDLSGLQPGDLLFFGSKASEKHKERVTHVAIYIGNSKFIHESSYIHIQSLNPEDPEYSKHRHDSFLYGKAILPLEGDDVNMALSNITLF